MARRRMTLRRIDPWSVLKFGAVVNVCLFVIFMLGSVIVWFAVRQLGIIDQACGLATDVGFENCAVNGSNLFRYLLLLGLLWIVIQTGLFVFFAFLHNLISDLVGGIAVTMSEEGTLAGGTGRTQRTGGADRTTGEQATQRSGLGTPPPRSDDAGGGASASAGAAATGRSFGSSAGSSSSGSGEGEGGSRGDDDERSPYDRGAPSAPPTTAPRQAEQRPGSSAGGWPWDPGSSPGTSDRGSPGSGSQDQPREDRDDDQLFGPRDR